MIINELPEDPDEDGEFILTNNSNTLTLKTTYEETFNGKVLKDVSTQVFKRK